ncbi:MAG TPA: hypothetical protein DCZ83_00235 [Candidatus Yonathbacteria bacterium]|nr:hypothetical protein [Candidatus Yonathbacteria bacterium]
MPYIIFMEKNPLEQRLSIDTSAIRDAAREELGQSFDNNFGDKEKMEDRFESLLFKMDLLQKSGAVLNKEETVRGLKESFNIKDKEVFVNYLLQVLDPIIMLRATQPDVFESVQREANLNNSGYLKLSEVLHFGLDGEEAQLHLAPSAELIKESGTGNFKKEVENGLEKLAEIIKSINKIKEIVATSWIVAKNPRLLEKLGFTIVGEISKEEKEKLFPDEKRTIAKAFMTREEFLARYGKE